jgi:hypothetical protein
MARSEFWSRHLESVCISQHALIKDELTYSMQGTPQMTGEAWQEFQLYLMSSCKMVVSRWML